jgi:phosphohistidine phosphatase
MKHLYLVRHAKSSWEHNVTDHERPLNKRGYSDAHLVSKHLKKNGLKLPDAVFSSDAMRAKTTANIFVDNLGLDESIIQLKHELYDFAGQQLIDTIKNCDDSVDVLMVFGHNFAMTNTVNNYGDMFTENVATAGFTHIAFDVNSWKDIAKGKTISSVYPKHLKSKS